MPLIVIGLSHRSSPVVVRERFAFTEARIPDALQSLRKSGAADEAVILSTCNRVEVYAATSLEPPRAFAAMQDFLLSWHDYRDPLTDEIYGLGEPQSVHHLFKVACGLDSMVLGETEILGQLKKAYELALKHGHTGGRLNKAFQRAFNVAKHIRSETSIQRGNVSVASVAVDLAEKIFSLLGERQVLVIGAGDTSEKTARAMISRGAHSLLVSNRSHDKAVALAAELGGRAVPFDDWSAEFGNVDIVISSTSAPHYILDRARLEPLMKLRRNRPLLLVDLAVPRDIEPEVNFLENVFLYNVDDLQSIADQSLKQRQEEVARCEQIIREKALHFAEPARTCGSRLKACSRPSNESGRVACCVLRVACEAPMTYEGWMETLPKEIKDDPLWRMEVYRLSLFAEDLAWPDVSKLVADKRTISLADQTFRAVGSVGANIAEGYSRQSGKDQARYYEYALGSAREARNWYWPARHVLTERVAIHRIRLLTHIVRLLLAIIPSERGYHLRDEPAEYNVVFDANQLLRDIPLPQDVG